MKLALILLLAGSVAQAQKFETPADLVQAVVDRYGKKWYKNVTFTQETIETMQDGTKKTAIWYEQLTIPSLLNIRFEPRAEGSGILFARDSIFSFDKGELKVARPLIHPLLVLGFDIFSQPAEKTVEKLKQLRFDMSVMHESTWQGRPAYVVGARAGDDSTKQFWFDKERLWLVRTVEKTRAGFVSEVQFNKYMKVDEYWIETEVLFLRDGKVMTEEYYKDIRTNQKIDPREYDPHRWNEGMK